MIYSIHVLFVLLIFLPVFFLFPLSILLFFFIFLFLSFYFYYPFYAFPCYFPTPVTTIFHPNQILPIFCASRLEIKYFFLKIAIIQSNHMLCPNVTKIIMDGRGVRGGSDEKRRRMWLRRDIDLPPLYDPLTPSVLSNSHLLSLQPHLPYNSENLPYLELDCLCKLSLELILCFLYSLMSFVSGDQTAGPHCY